MMFFELLAAIAGLGPCPPLPGAAELFADPRTRVVWVGEVHGSTEQPMLFADLVCAASETGRPVVVDLERSEGEQAAWDAFMASDGGMAAESALMKGSDWTWAVQDGRCSLAMLKLAERLRVFKHQGRIQAVRMMIPSGGPSPVDVGAHEAALARSVQSSLVRPSNPLALAFSGNAHAKKGENTFRGQTYKLAATNLPSREVVSVVLSGGSGDVWDCQAMICGPHPYVANGVHPRGVSLKDAPTGFDAIAYTGAPTTASPPAARPPTPVEIPAS